LHFAKSGIIVCFSRFPPVPSTERVKMRKMAKLDIVTLSDGSVVYNVNVFDIDGKRVGVIGAVDERNALILVSELNNAGWFEINK